MYEHFPERYHLEISISHRSDYFSGEVAYNNLWQAKQRAAIWVATHKRIARARVWDTHEKRYVYSVDNPLIARAEIIEWG